MSRVTEITVQSSETEQTILNVTQMLGGLYVTRDANQFVQHGAVEGHAAQPAVTRSTTPVTQL